MTQYQAGSGSGSSLEGAPTSPVGLSGGLSPRERKTLCGVFCKCKLIGVATKSGSIQRQRCVQMRLNADNEVSKVATGSPTEYRPEQPYDMTKAPPAPIMDLDDPLEPTPSLRDWIDNFWPGGRRKYKASEGNVRRPDVVIVNDPSEPPYQSNIKTVVEMKFPGDSYGDNQERDYVRIAGSRSKFAHLGVENCGCDDNQSQRQTASSPQTAPESDLDELYGGDGTARSSGLPALPAAPLPLFRE